MPKIKSHFRSPEVVEKMSFFWKKWVFFEKNEFFWKELSKTTIFSSVLLKSWQIPLKYAIQLMSHGANMINSLKGQILTSKRDFLTKNRHFWPKSGLHKTVCKIQTVNAEIKLLRYSESSWNSLHRTYFQNFCIVKFCAPKFELKLGYLIT